MNERARNEVVRHLGGLLQWGELGATLPEHYRLAVVGFLYAYHGSTALGIDAELVGLMAEFTRRHFPERGCDASREETP